MLQKGFELPPVRMQRYAQAAKSFVRPGATFGLKRFDERAHPDTSPARPRQPHHRTEVPFRVASIRSLRN
ncbi:MAG: hypothetical protein ACLSHC_00755 [Bilophila wadsworthia]